MNDFLRFSMIGAEGSWTYVVRFRTIQWRVDTRISGRVMGAR